MPAAAVLPGLESISADVAGALAEDIGTGDLTAGLVARKKQVAARVICREPAVLAGQAWFDETFRQLDPAVRTDWCRRDGECIGAGEEVGRLHGPARAILTGERTALNFIQTLSATATVARECVDAVRGTEAVVLDTRKTIPGLRQAQKYAVRCGGARNHRMGLYDAMLIKENHIDAAGSITLAVQRARRLHPNVPLEVEVESLAQLAEAGRAGVKRALLDNFQLSELRAAVARFGGAITLEASGGINLDSIKAVAETGVDCISIGSLTKNVRAADFSMRFA